jgi:hypothetical protein
MHIDMKGCTITRNRKNVLTVHTPDGWNFVVSSWAEAMEVVDMRDSKSGSEDEQEEDEDDEPPFVMDPTHVDFVLRGLDTLVDTFESIDGKPRKACMFLFTRENNGAVGVNLIGNIDKDWLHEMLRNWMHGETQ